MTASEFAQRPATPKEHYLTRRDKLILVAIHAREGMLSPSQVMRLWDEENGEYLFKPGSGLRQAQDRLSRLFDNGYLKRPSRRKRASFDEMVYLLDKLGAEVVAGKYGGYVSKLQWRDKPRWSMVNHDLQLNDFRLFVEAFARKTDGFSVSDWVSSSEFWSEPDAINYQGKKREVKPDGYFLATVTRTKKGKERFFDFRLLPEIDMDTETSARIGRDKVLVLLKYLNSKPYRERFGVNSGQVLFATIGKERRVQNMKAEVERVAGKDAHAFYFTSFDWIDADSVLDARWYQGGHNRLVSPIDIPS